MTLEEIQQLIRLVAETGLGEVEIKRSGVHVRISRHGSVAVTGAHAPAASPAASHAAAAAAPPESPRVSPPSAAPPPAPEDEQGLHVIAATMVGTFYRRPNPEAAAFVKDGDQVRKGQVICILEAMKILNEIESDVSGTIVSIHAEDAQPVEFGEKLFTIRLA